MSSAPAADKQHRPESLRKQCSLGAAGAGLPPTCRFGPGEDEGGGAAAAHHLVAGVQVDAVDGEGFQQRDLDGLGRHLVL